MLLRCGPARLAIGVCFVALGLMPAPRAAAAPAPARAHAIARVVPGVGPLVAVTAPVGRAARVMPVPAVAARRVALVIRRHARGKTGHRARVVDHIPLTASSAGRFLPLYRRASATFGVSWRLIASIHQQETGFSSARGTYRGLNFAGCCAGPMQFNVANGPVSTWERFRGAFRRAERPVRYPHRTRRHPSIYDDFDAIMAAGALLRASGAGAHLDGAAWLASYHYYGHDLTGLKYADRVLARATGWARRGLCGTCPVDERLVGSFDDAFARPYRAQLLAAQRLARKRARAQARARDRRRHAHEQAVAAAKRRAEAAARHKARRSREARRREKAKPSAKPPALKALPMKTKRAVTPKPVAAPPAATAPPPAPPASGGQAAS
jgi:hypothetical protein